MWPPQRLCSWKPPWHDYLWRQQRHAGFISASRKNVIVVLGIQDKGSNRIVICFWSPAQRRRKGRETATISNQMCTFHLVLFGDVITVLHLYIMFIAATFCHYKTCEQRKLVILRICLSFVSTTLLFDKSCAFHFLSLFSQIHAEKLAEFMQCERYSTNLIKTGIRGNIFGKLASIKLN
jgi:hypothetical protein